MRNNVRENMSFKGISASNPAFELATNIMCQKCGEKRAVVLYEERQNLCRECTVSLFGTNNSNIIDLIIKSFNRGKINE